MAKHTSSSEWIGNGKYMSFADYRFAIIWKTEPIAREDRAEEDEAAKGIHPLSALQIAAGDIGPRTQSLSWMYGADPESTWRDPEEDT